MLNVTCLGDAIADEVMTRNPRKYPRLRIVFSPKNGEIIAPEYPEQKFFRARNSSGVLATGELYVLA